MGRVLSSGEALGSHTMLSPTHDEALARLEREVRHFRALVEATSDWLWEIDPQGSYTYASPQVRELLGYEVSEVLGRTPFDFMDTAEAERVRSVFQAHLDAHTRFERVINVNLHKDGHEVVLETSGVPVFDQAGRFDGFRGIDRDVTDRRHADRRLRLADAAMRSAAEGIIVADAEGRVSTTNHAFLLMTGLDEHDVVGHQPSMLACGDGGSRGRIWDYLRGASKWSGEGSCRHRTGDTFPVWLTLSSVHEPESARSGYVALVSDMTERRAAEATIRFQATHDALTQLANRAAFMNALDRALADARMRLDRVGVLFVDLDGFKAVNDRHGHGVGDVLLAAVARRLERCARKTDFVARFGGDEFTLLLRDLAADHVPRRVAKAIVAAMAEPFRVDGTDLRVTASVGLALFPDDGDSTDALIDAADRAMYVAKRGGGAQVATPPAKSEPLDLRRPRRTRLK